MLVDAHCHLDDGQFVHDIGQVIARATDAGVGVMITAGTDIASSQAAVTLADKYAAVYAAVGIHPHHAGSYSGTALKAIRTLAQHPRVVAIGEIGLDFHYPDGAPAEVQQKNLIAHLDLAQELGKPVVLHNRDAHRELMKILTEPRIGLRGILHCFSGDIEMARQAIKLGYMISFAGNVTFVKARQLQAVAQDLELENILVETDSPYLSPLRGRRNEPANMRLTVAKIAELHRVPAEQVEAVTRANSTRMFGLRIAD